MKRFIVMLLAAGLLFGCSDNTTQDDTTDTTDTTNANGNASQEKEKNSEEVNATEEEAVEEPVEPTPQQKMLSDIKTLFDEEKAFDAGSYTKGDIPKGEYVFSTFQGSGNYYSEEEAGGSIVDNENFDSFGYVKVHGIGNIQNSGVLVSVDALSELEVSGAKELYKKINGVDDYKESGWYKVGVDIDPGEYVIESFGEGYVSVLTGPVGDNEIVNNQNFNGKYSVNVKEGQYLKVSGGGITES